MAGSQSIADSYLTVTELIMLCTDVDVERAGLSFQLHFSYFDL